ncbi:MAG: hypothetical protein R2749_24240 [Acidimicrobiales bacterium]
MLLTMAVSDVDRHRALLDGRVTIDAPDGVRIEVVALPVQEMFDRLLGGHEFDISEMPIASYARMVAAGDPPYLAVPIFPSRYFRHSCVFVHKGAGLRGPADLAGRRIGVAVWDMAAAVWLRGIFRDDDGLDPRAPIYVTGGQDAPRAGEAHPQVYPDGYTLEHIGPDACLSDLLADGGIDALYTARAPRTYFSHPDRVGRLFADPMAVERDYFARTGNFPIMHTLALRSSVVAEHPALAAAVADAFERSLQLALANLHESAALPVSLPWLVHHAEQTDAQFGRDLWRNGIDANRAGLALLLGYLADEGLLARPLTVDELFPLGA